MTGYRFKDHPVPLGTITIWDDRGHLVHFLSIGGKYGEYVRLLSPSRYNPIGTEYSMDYYNYIVTQDFEL